jgi:hypothetical protein
LVPRQLMWKKLQRDFAPQREVFGLVYNTHASATQLARNTVMRDGLVDHAAGAKVFILGKNRMVSQSEASDEL